MRTKTIVSLLAVLVLLGACAGGYAMLNRGAPATAAVAIVDAALPEAGSEFKPQQDSTEGVAGMELAARQGELGLYISQETTQTAVKDYRSGKIWLSNPAGLNEDRLAQPFEKAAMASQFTVSYRDPLTMENKFRSFPDSVEKKQFKLEAIKDGVRVVYTLGDNSKGMSVLPKLISKARLQEKVLDNLSESQARYVSMRYYPTKANPDVLELLEDQVKSPLVLNKMTEAFAAAGYTEQDLALDNEENGSNGSQESGKKARFVVPLEYRLIDGRLSVRIPVGSVEETEGFSIRTIELMNFFGAAGEAEQGYMLVPDGSGSLIYLNNGKVSDDAYSQVVYGMDRTDNALRRAQVSESARLPVFGLKSGDAAWYGVISQGEAIASIDADIAGKTNVFNHVYASFQVRGEDILDLVSGGKSNEIPIMTKELYKGDIEVQYGFLAKDEANYAGMAAQYRDMLVKEAGMKPIADKSGALPFYVDVIGAVTKSKSFLGVPYDALYPVTTFGQAGEIADALSGAGIGNVRMRMLGWSAGGVYHEPSAAKPLGKLGGASGMETLAAKLKSQGGALYPDTALLHVYEDTRGFTPSSDAARFITREVALRAPYNRALNRMDEDLGTYYLLSASKLPAFVDRFSNRYAKLDLAALSLRDLGDEVNGDYRESRLVNRQTAMNIAAGELGKLKQQYPDLMVEGGNSYALPYASHIVNAPMASSSFNIADESVPFYQLVMHGFVDYAGEAVNLSADQDADSQLLRMLEYGASPRFVWTYEPSSSLKFTKFDYLYSTHYTDWLQQAAKVYSEANKVLASVRNVPMTGHEKLQDGVYRTMYGSGLSVIVNYNDSPAVVDGRTIEPNHYLIGGEGA